NGRELSRDWHKSLSELAFHIPARLGTSRTRVLNKPRCDNQLCFALCADAAPHTQAGNAPAVNRPGEDLRRRRTAGAGLLGGKSLVARRVGAAALCRKVMRPARRDCAWYDHVFRRRVLAAGERSA